MVLRERCRTIRTVLESVPEDFVARGGNALAAGALEVAIQYTCGALELEVENMLLDLVANRPC